MELLVAMTITLALLAVASTLFGRAFGVKARESSRTDALTSAQAALNVISREVGNSGYGLVKSDGYTPVNGIVIADSNEHRLRVRSNVDNIGTAMTTESLGEDLTYYYDADTSSIVRSDPKQNPKTSYVVNRISNVKFKYFDYVGSTSSTTGNNMPTENTGRVQITVEVKLDPVQGQPDNRTVVLTSDVTLRNSNYMINQY